LGGQKKSGRGKKKDAAQQRENRGKKSALAKHQRQRGLALLMQPTVEKGSKARTLSENSWGKSPVIPNQDIQKKPKTKH